MEDGDRVFKPKGECFGHGDALCEQRDAEKQNAGVAQEDDDAGKQVTLGSDIALLRLKSLKCQRDVERVGRAHQQMKIYEESV